jgi:hypothetical protein
LTAFWKVAVSRLLQGPFRVEKPRISEDGRLSPTAGQVTLLDRAIEEAALACVASHLVSSGLDPGFTSKDRPVALLPVTGLGEIHMDEPHQQVIWKVPVAGGAEPLLVRQPVTPATTHRVDSLLALVEQSPPVAYVLVERAEISGRATWKPVTAFLRRSDGLELFSFDFSTPPQEPERFRNVVRKRWTLLWRRWLEQPGVPAVSRPAVAVVCDQVRDLTLDLAATGRTTPTAEQRRHCEVLAGRLEALALTTLAHAVRQIIQQPGPESVLRAQHIADRAATIAVSS